VRLIGTLAYKTCLYISWHTQINRSYYSIFKRINLISNAISHRVCINALFALFVLPAHFACMINGRFMEMEGVCARVTLRMQIVGSSSLGTQRALRFIYCRASTNAPLHVCSLLCAIQGLSHACTTKARGDKKAITKANSL